MRVTFDSNVWEHVLFAERHPADTQYACLLLINQALRSGRIHGAISEVCGTLEAIKKQDRATYFSSPTVRSEANIGGTASDIRVQITFRAGHAPHPGLPRIQDEALQEARSIGMRLLSAPRLNLPVPCQFDRDSYEPECFGPNYIQRFGEALDAIEARGVGSAAITAIIRRIEQRMPMSSRGSGMGIHLLAHPKDDNERAEIKKATAEWADGDMVASHIGSGNDVLCTRDEGKSAGPASVFDAANRAWLSATYGVKFVNVKELAELL